MLFYSASDTVTILQKCLENLERSDDRNDPAIAEMKRVLLLRLAELETHKDRSGVTSAYAGTDYPYT